MEVLQRSAALCKQSYQKPSISILSGENVIEKKSLALNHAQRQVFLLLIGEIKKQESNDSL